NNHQLVVGLLPYRLCFAGRCDDAIHAGIESLLGARKYQLFNVTLKPHFFDILGVHTREHRNAKQFQAGVTPAFHGSLQYSPNAVNGQKIYSQLRGPLYGISDGFFNIEILVIEENALALLDQVFRKAVSSRKLKAES